jgi:tetratricopeptide (TPR) repeat protein
MTRTIRKIAARILTAAALTIPAAAFAEVSTTPVAATHALSGKELYANTLKGTCWVVTKNGWGTGWVVDAGKKLVITNNHVIDGFDAADVYFPVAINGKIDTDPQHYKTSIKVKVVDRDLTRDLAILQLDSIPAGVQSLKLATVSAEPGDALRTVGSLPVGSEGLWGTAVGEVRLVTPHRINGGTVMEIESTIPTNGGNSGGPIVNDRGEVVAVHRAVRLDAVNVSLHIDVTEVRAYLNEALPIIEAKTAEQLLARGQRHIKVGRLALAHADLTEAIKLDPNFTAALILRGAVTVDRNDAKAALPDLDAALKLDPKSARALIVRGIANRALNKLDDAVADFDSAIAIDPKNVDAHRQRALTLLVAKKPADALNAIDKAIELNKTDHSLLAIRAAAHQALGKLADAVSDREAAVKLAAVHNNFNELGIAHFRNKDFAKAAEAFAQAAKLSPLNPVYHANLGDALRLKGSHAEAVKAYSDAIALVERGARFDLTFTFFGRGVSRRETKEFQSAVADLNRAITLNGKIAQFYRERGLAQKAIGATEAADEDFAAAAKLDPKSAPVAAAKTPETKPIVAAKPAETTETPAKTVEVKAVNSKPAATVRPAITPKTTGATGCASGRGCH